MGTTTNYAIPYPEPTDFVTDGAQAMENIAETVDAQMFAQVANRNLLYNGAMQVAQRNTNVPSITTSGYYTADRWYTGLGGLGTWTQTIENDAPSGSGFRKSWKMNCTTADASPAAGDLFVLAQLLEGQDLQAVRKGTAQAQSLTLSFWVKTNVSGTYIVNLYDNDNTRQISKSYVVNATNTWEYKTLTFAGDTTGVWDNDNNCSVEVNWFLGAGSNFTSGTLATSWASYVGANRAVGQVNLASATNNYWQITGVQLTIGTVAPPFQFKNFGQELRECQRYYEKTYDVTTAPASNTTAGISYSHVGVDGSGNATQNLYFRTPKRTASYTMTFYQNTGTVTSWAYGRSGAAGVATVNNTQAGMTQTTMYMTVGGSWTVAYIYGHWTCDAEL